MPICTICELVDDAAQRGGAVGAFNVSSMEMILGVVKAAEYANRPVILQIAEKRLKHSPLHVIGPAMVGAAKEARIPVAVQFDHGNSFECLKQAIDIGFSSLMYDGSELPLQNNIANTLKAKQLAQNAGVSIEAELGQVGGNESSLSDEIEESKGVSVEDVVEFCSQTKVDALAVAIGNAHGFYLKAPKLDFQLLRDVHECVAIPLVLHGGTGLTDDDFRRCIKLGMRKVNIGTSNFFASAQAAKNCLNSIEKPNYFKMNEAMVQAVFECTLRYINLFSEVEGEKR